MTNAPPERYLVRALYVVGTKFSRDGCRIHPGHLGMLLRLGVDQFASPGGGGEDNGQEPVWCLHPTGSVDDVDDGEVVDLDEKPGFFA